MQNRVEKRTVNVHIAPKATKKSENTLPSSEDLAKKYGVDDEINQERNIKKSLEESELKIKELKELTTEYSETIFQLKEKLTEKNKKIDNLCTLLEAAEPVPGIDTAKLYNILEGALPDEEIDLRDRKIVSLAKKSHNLTMQVNSSKALNDRLLQENNEFKSKHEASLKEIELLQAKIKKLHATQASLGETKYSRYNNPGATNTTTTPSQNNEDTKIVEQETSKAYKELVKNNDELKKKVKELEEEKKKVEKALLKEVGDGVTLEQAVDGGWRGRAQQIIMLKAKIKQLENGSQTSSRTSLNKNVDTKAEDELVEMSRERRQIVDALTEERIQLIETVSQQEKKQSALKARIATLEAEIKKYKNQLVSLVSKSESDDELIEMLKNEKKKLLATIKELEQKLESKKNNNNVDPSLKNQEYENEIRRLERLCRNQAEQLDSQDITIRDLRKKLNPY